MSLCEKCGKLFDYPSGLKRHEKRKTPCDKHIDKSIDIILKAKDISNKYKKESLVDEEDIEDRIEKEYAIDTSDVEKILGITIDDKYEKEYEGSIYIISCQRFADDNLYKVGRHKGKKNKLISRYKTYLIEPILYSFIGCNNYVEQEKRLKRILSEYHQNKTEWVKLEIDTLKEIVKSNIME